MTTTVFDNNQRKVENKIPDNSKCTTTQEFSNLTTENFAARLKEAYLLNKTHFDNKLTSFNKRIISIKQNIFNFKRN